MADSKTVFAYIGIGCVVIAGILALGAGACGVWVYNEAQQFEREMADPEARGERVLEVLGAETLPEGYFPMMAFSVPFVMDSAMLSDEPLPEDADNAEFGERGFLYLKMLRMGQDEQELRDYFEGRSDDPDVLGDNGINIDIDEIIDRGSFEQGAARLLYVVQRGNVSMGRGGRGGGLASMTMVECPDDSRLRLGFWFVPDPDPEAAPGDLDLAGTPGDPAALQAFYSHFDLCG